MSNFQKTVLSIIAGLKMQQAELNDLKSIFIGLDTDKNGTLSKDELRDGLKACKLLELLQAPNPATSTASTEDEHYRILLERMDLDNDGRIDYLEFIQAAIDQQSLLNKENLGIVFNLIDVNNDGKLSIQELMTVFATGEGAANLQKHHQEN